MSMDFLQALQPFAQTTQVLRGLQEASAQQQQLDMQKSAQAAEQDYRKQDMALRQDAANRSDVQTRQSLLENGRPAGQGATVLQQVNSPATPLPGAGISIPGQSQQSGVPVDPSRIIDFKGTRVYQPTADEQAQADLGNKVNQARALADATSWGIPDAMADRMKVPRGTKVPHEAVSHVFAEDENAQASPAPEKKTGLQFHPVQNDNGDVTAFTFDPSTGKVAKGQTFTGVGKRKDEGGGSGGGKDDAAPKVSAAQLRMVTEKKMTGLRKAQADYSKSLQDPLTSPAEAQQKLLADKQSTQDEYEQTLEAWGMPVEHFDYASQQPQQPQQQQASASAKQPAAANKAPDKTGAKAPDKTAAKPATLENVRAYAKQKGVTEAQAIREFQQYGYQIGGK